MKTFKDLLIRLKACPEAIKWAKDMPIEECVENCPRGDWLLWLGKSVQLAAKNRYAAKTEQFERNLYLTGGYSASTVLHIMDDQGSKDAVKAAIAYGKGEIAKKELTQAFNNAFVNDCYDSEPSAFDAFADFKSAKEYALNSTYFSEYSAYHAASPFYTPETASASAASAASAASYAYGESTTNQKETADICRKHIGKDIIDSVNFMLKNHNNPRYGNRF